MPTPPRMRFELAEIVDPATTGATVRYSQGWNMTGTEQHEVIQLVLPP